ncbi:hypothetical protein BGX29_008619 [Mortierella sp. GBA35]|nr:hypothetical protein BGX29_008619 [Mortierella sp. GBA35]
MLENEGRNSAANSPLGLDVELGELGHKIMIGILKRCHLLDLGAIEIKVCERNNNVVAGKQMLDDVIQSSLAVFERVVGDLVTIGRKKILKGKLGAE